MLFCFHKNFLFALLFGFACATFAFAGDHGFPGIPERPHGTHVYDEDRVLSSQDIQFIDSLSQLLQEKAGVEIAVALVDDVGDMDFRKFAIATSRKWNIGEDSEGILIFAALRQKRRTVEIGRGTEAYLAGDLVEKIQQRTLVPAFRLQRYGQGVTDLVWELSQVICKAKNTSIDMQPRNVPQEQGVSVGGFLFIAAVILFLIAAKFGGGRGKGLLWFLAGNAIAKSGKRSNKSFDGNFGSGFKRNFGDGFGGGI